ncbi:hypothetical protein SGFS_011680 [Streptomyces graminofaciens]|uniref:Hydrolase n=1 Tax=Streptomyces graminofaciens TaxID=68212 RepID=A0ABM7F258_9ACTN|nr:hypothetical protein [Streptomyces graminofaciens]BBC29874.1 hypothetical protein SGFS_011680 [Streptomyces graminofaciens]
MRSNAPQAPDVVSARAVRRLALAPPAHGEPEAEGTTIAARRAEYWPGTGHCLHEERAERTMRLIREWADGETANGTWLRR